MYRLVASLACDERVFGVSFDSFGLLMYLLAILKARALVMGSALASRMLENAVSTNNKVLSFVYLISSIILVCYILCQGCVSLRPLKTNRFRLFYDLGQSNPPISPSREA